MYRYSVKLCTKLCVQHPCTAVQVMNGAFYDLNTFLFMFRCTCAVQLYLSYCYNYMYTCMWYNVAMHTVYTAHVQCTYSVPYGCTCTSIIIHVMSHDIIVQYGVVCVYRWRMKKMFWSVSKSSLSSTSSSDHRILLRYAYTCTCAVYLYNNGEIFEPILLMSPPQIAKFMQFVMTIYTDLPKTMVQY